MPKQGYIKLHRQIQDCWIWTDDDEKFDKRSAWIDLLLLANHKNVKIAFDGKLIVVERGQHITSIRKLATRWNWSTNKVTRFLDLLASDQMIIRESDTKKTLITIVNYDVYQFSEDTNETLTRQQRDTNETATRLNKNDKNVKNEKNEKNEKNVFRKPSLEEVKAYIEEKGYSIDAERFINYYESNGWMVGRNKMKTWKAAVSNWASKDKPKTNTSYDDAAKAFLESED
ncbi:MAG: hypothetical protein J6X12_12975 [Paludibacteraceae bacterium]|nr:hypothetical protein [Paludibacteraceae bacterium]